MHLTEQTQSIIQLVWSRMLKLADDRIESAPAGSRIEAGEDGAGALMLVRLFDRTVLYGPPELLARARGLPDAQLVQESTLLDVARQHDVSARSLGQAELLYGDQASYTGLAPLHPEGTVVSHESEHLDALLTHSPADDVALSGLREAEWAATLVTEQHGQPGVHRGASAEAEGQSGNDAAAAGFWGHLPLAGAGWEVWHHMLGHIGVLTPPQHRMRGYAASIASVAVQEALDEGLIPQWRAALSSPGSARLARSLSFVPAGSQTTVVLSPEQ